MPSKPFSLSLNSSSEFELGTSTVNFEVIVTNQPVVSVSLSPNTYSVVKNGKKYTYREIIFSLDQPIQDNLPVQFVLGGSAVEGVDYATLPRQVSFIAGQTTIVLRPTAP